MRSVIVRALLASVVAASMATAQDSAQHASCRDPHPAPVCDAYFLFEYTGAARVAGTRIPVVFETKDALRSWFAWDIGWMKNTSPSLSLGAAFEAGGSADGTRLAMRLTGRRWLAHNLVVDASAGPLMAMLQNGGSEGMTPTYGFTAEAGFGRARLGLVTIGADMAKQRGEMQFATHVGGKAESRGAVVVTAVAAIGAVILLSAIGSSSSGGFSFY